MSLRTVLLFLTRKIPVNHISAPVRLVAFLIAFMLNFLYAKFLHECNEAWQVGPTTIMLGSMIFFMTAFAFRTRKATPYILFAAVAVFLVGVDWFFIAGGNPDVFYPVHGGIAFGFLLLVLTSGIVMAMRHNRDERGPQILA